MKKSEKKKAFGHLIDLKISNYKAFQGIFSQGFNGIKPVNVIIGRNNTGKSTLLDLVEYVIRTGQGETYSELNNQYPVTEKTQFRIHDRFNNKNVDSYAKDLRDIHLSEFFLNRNSQRIQADRDITNEISDERKMELLPNGEGATFILERFLNATNQDRTLVRNILLNELNTIFSPDTFFKDIICRQHDNREWEIYLEEDHKGMVSLTDSGSGIKTILLVLINLILLPEIQQKDIKSYFFCFEELENNLHPSILRRLFKYITDFSRKNKCHFFITTHSSIVIDLFSSYEEAQILHVFHDGKTATVNTITSFTDNKFVINDLGVKASDLLQANGIIWLEGPSDRIYFNKWMEIYAPDLKEHVDYECAFYAGSLLKHYDSVFPVRGVGILNINTNAVLIGDSDKRTGNAKLKPSLKNIKKNLEDLKGFVWVTEVKEIENYIPAESLEKVFEKENLPELKQYQSFFNIQSVQFKTEGYWQQHCFPGTFDKVALAHKVTKYFTKDNLAGRFDLPEQMEKIVCEIRRWNENR